MNISEILKNVRVQGLSPSSFKAYFFLVEKAGDQKIIQKFTIIGQAREWEENKNINLISSKNTMKKILKELEEARLIRFNREKRELKIL